MAALYEIPTVFNIPSSCREAFLPLRAGFAQPLHDRGISLAGLSLLQPGYKIGRNPRDCHVLIFTIEGRARFRLPWREDTLEAGQVWICPAGVPHLYWPEGPWRILWFHLWDDAEWAFPKGEDAVVREAHFLDHMLEATERYLANAVPEGPDTRPVAKAYAEILGHLLEREMRPDEDPADAVVRHRLDRLLEEINLDLARSWRVEDLCRRLHMSPAQLHRTTQRLHGVPPMELVQRLRMRRAEELLLATDYTLERIASLVAYETPFAFSRAFKRRYGVSPGGYREAR